MNIIPFSGSHVDSGGLVVLALTVVVAIVSIPSIIYWTVDSWARFRRERDFEQLLKATLIDLQRSASLSERGSATLSEPGSRLREEDVDEPPLNRLVVRALLGEVQAEDDQNPNAPGPVHAG
jgi:hypothetical protein